VHALVVDDHPVNLRIATGQLTPAGCRVSVAATAREAIERWQVLEAERDRPDIVILDHNLPDHSGTWVASRIQAGAAGAVVPIVYLSSIGGLLELPAASDCVRILTKPRSASYCCARWRN